MQNLHMIIAVDRAGFVGEDGVSHQGLLDSSFLNTIPNITVYSPSDYQQLRPDFVNAIYHTEGVVVVRYPRGREFDEPETLDFESEAFDIYGSRDADNCIVTFGRVFANAVKAADKLNAEGKSFSVIRLNRIKPIDEEAVKSVLNCKKVYFFEEGIKSGGIGESFLDMLNEHEYKGGFKLTAVDNQFVEHAGVQRLYERYMLDENGIYTVCSE